MKRIFSVVMLAAIALSSCNKESYHYSNLEPGYGILSLADASISVSEETETRAATDNYCIWVINSDGAEVDLDKNSGNTYVSYSSIASTGIKLPAGNYTLVAQSQTSISAAAFEEPVYGAEQAFSIIAGETTNIGKIVCKLWKQVKATVDYNAFFLQHLAGEGKATVTVNNSNALEYNIVGNSTEKPTSQEKRAGYFEVPNYKTDADLVSLEVEFVGSMLVKESGSNEYSTKNQKMRVAIPNVKSGQWRKIQFNMAEDKDGNAAFTITIDDLVVDVTIGEDVTAGEESLGDDPNKPKGDGNIQLLNIAGLDDTTTPTQAEWNGAFTTDDEMDEEVYPVINISQDMSALKFNAIVPNKVAAFTVEIISDALEEAVMAVCGTTKLDLVDNTTAVEKVAGIIPFPYGDTVRDKEVVEFDLTGALGALKGIPGTDNNFSMTVIDKQGYSKTIDLVLHIEE